MKNFKQKKVVITGGGSGIGKAIIAELSNEGVRDFAVWGRNVEKLKTLESIYPDANFILFSGDVSVLKDVQKFTKILEEKWGDVDILINSAGVVSAGSFEHMPDEDIIAMTNTNVTGVLLLTKYSLPLLKKSNEAAILNVSSGLGLIGLPFYVPYAATKGAIKSFSESLRRELKDFPIQVATLYPTGTDTPMMETAEATNLHAPEMVAKRAIDGLRNNAIDIILSDEASVKLNLKNPLEYDTKVASMFEVLKKRAAKHRAM